VYRLRIALVSRRIAIAAVVLLFEGCGGSGVVDPGTGSPDGGDGGLIIGASCDSCVCTPNTGSCSGGKAKACKPDGSGFVEFECDPVQGMTCAPDGCKGSCASSTIDASYIGCDYYPTVTLNPVWSGFDFAVAVGNASDVAARVTVTRGTAAVASQTIDKKGIAVIKLPWVAELKGGDVDACQEPPDPGATRVVAGGAYRLRSDVPVTVYQFSPLTYEIDPAPANCPIGTQCPGGLESACKSFSNDASLLLPATALTGNYTGLAWPSSPNRSGFLAVTATQDDTDVELVSPRGAFIAGGGIDGSGHGTVKLARGDVLEVLASHDAPPRTFGSDLSGTIVHASHPVQVIGGHSCANVPLATTGYCDHLEQGLFPIETLGTDYLVGIPAGLGADSPHVVRVAAVYPNTRVTFDPPIAPETMLGPDDAPLQVNDVTSDVRIRGDKALLVAQYMQGSSSVPSGSGDPSMSLAIPTAQFRTSYVFLASATYDTNFVNVTAPAGADVTLDGAPIAKSEFHAIGASGFSVARHELASTDFHEIASSVPFGIVVYGYGKDTSYMYPGGLDLKRITEPPVR
jgi:IgGFc binding protein